MRFLPLVTRRRKVSDKVSGRSHCFIAVNVAGLSNTSIARIGRKLGRLSAIQIDYADDTLTFRIPYLGRVLGDIHRIIRGELRSYLHRIALSEMEYKGGEGRVLTGGTGAGGKPHIRNYAERVYQTNRAALDNALYTYWAGLVQGETVITFRTKRMTGEAGAFTLTYRPGTKSKREYTLSKRTTRPKKGRIIPAMEEQERNNQRGRLVAAEQRIAQLRPLHNALLAQYDAHDAHSYSNLRDGINDALRIGDMLAELRTEIALAEQTIRLAYSVSAEYIPELDRALVDDCRMADSRVHPERVNPIAIEYKAGNGENPVPRRLELSEGFGFSGV